MESTSSKVQDVAKSAKETAAQAREEVMDLTEGREDIPTPMRVVKNLGITSGMAYTAGVASIFLSLAMWFFRRGGNRETAGASPSSSAHGRLRLWRLGRP
jgi:hypothetical protein